MHVFRCVAVVLALAPLKLACAPQRPVAKLSGQREPAPVLAPKPAASAPAAPLALEEDERGIVGAPQDDTAFAFDALFAESAEPPQITGGEPVPPSIRRSLAPFLESRRARLASMTPDGKQMLVLTQLGKTTQVHWLDGPLRARRQVTFGSEPITQAMFKPRDPDTVVFRVDTGGEEDFQIGSIELTSRRLRSLSDGTSRHGSFRYDGTGQRLAYTSNARNGVDMDVYVQTQTEAPRRFELSGQWLNQGWSKDNRQILLHEFRSKTHSMLHLLDVETGERHALDEQREGYVYPMALFSKEPGVLYVMTNRGHDRVGVFVHELSSGSWTPLFQSQNEDVEELVQLRNSLLFSTNAGGYSVLRQMDLKTRKVSVLQGIPRGVVSSIRGAGTRNEIAFTLNQPTQPPDAYTYSIADQKLTRWTESEVGGIPPRRFIAPEPLQIPTFDGNQIPTWIYRPRGEGPFPVLLWIHGGPEDQSRPTFEPIIQYFATSMNVAVVVPNVRGSEGYGQHYMNLDNGVLREDSVKDVGAVLDWIDGDPGLDRERVGIYGVSYGGYMVLASLSRYPERLKAGCDQVGISNWITFLENTREYRRDARRREYGDETDPAVRRFLREISPIHRASKIRSPLLVAHGANDPRVPLAEAQAIVDAVRANGTPVWFFIAQGEGHGFRKQQNRDAFYENMAAFFRRYLVGENQE